MERLIAFLEERGVEYGRHYPAEHMTTLGIGGRAAVAATARQMDELLDLLAFLKHAGDDAPPWVLLGGGSNVVFPDGEAPLLAILNRCGNMRLDADSQLAVVDSGVQNNDFIRWTAEHNVGGLDYMAGVPGTIGGAVAVNAGAFGCSISQNLVKASIYERKSGEIKMAPKDDFHFQYRDSRHKYGEDVILQIYLRYEPLDNEEIKNRNRQRLDYRRTHHPPRNLKTAGCFFKNPVIDGQKQSAGRLIESAGFKGSAFGPLSISPQHANFIINSGNGAFADIRDLEQHIISSVARQHGVRLEREVIYITPDGKKY